MHEDESAAQFRDGGEHVRVHGAAGHVVDDVCSRLDGGAGDAGVERVDAERRVPCFGERTDVFDRREDACEFDVWREELCAGPRGLAADVDNGSAGGDVGEDGRCEGFGVGSVGCG